MLFHTYYRTPDTWLKLAVLEGLRGSFYSIFFVLAPALVLLLRGVNGIITINRYLSTLPRENLGSHLESRDQHAYLISSDWLQAYDWASMFFKDKNLFADDSVRHLQKFLPPSLSKIKAVIKG